MFNCVWEKGRLGGGVPQCHHRLRSNFNRVIPKEDKETRIHGQKADFSLLSRWLFMCALHFSLPFPTLPFSKSSFHFHPGPPTLKDGDASHLQLPGNLPCLLPVLPVLNESMIISAFSCERPLSQCLGLRCRYLVS